MLRSLEARARRAFLLAPFACLAAATVSPAGAADVVNIYSYRQPDLIRPMLDAFTAETGIQTQVIFAEKGLEERIRRPTSS
jgi:iron(III) transport system substrate-binding protein